MSIDRVSDQPRSGGDYREVNRVGWDALSRLGIESSTPWDVNRMRRPRVWLDGYRWLPWHEIDDVLVVGGGGGQQASLFAWLGCRVTVVDLSPAQLDRDRVTCTRLGLELECVEADMCDLSVLGRRHYDLVYQPVSTCYVPDVRSCYQQVASVLRPNGFYWSQHWNPTHVQVSPEYAWDGTAYRIDHAAADHSPRTLSGPGQSDGPLCWHYAHPLGDLLGGICDSGFTIERFAEHGEADLTAVPGSGPHLGAYLAPFYVLLARLRRRSWQ
jgi:SAM-dependent methyltransferase